MWGQVIYVTLTLPHLTGRYVGTGDLCDFDTSPIWQVGMWGQEIYVTLTFPHLTCRYVGTGDLCDFDISPSNR